MDKMSIEDIIRLPETISSLLIEGNLFHKLIGKRKPLNKDMRARLDSLRYNANKKSEYTHNINIEVFKNNVYYFKDLYYEVSEFEQLISEKYNNI